MNCLGPECAAMLLEWLRNRLADSPAAAQQQGTLFAAPPYNEDAPAIRSMTELRGAVEHLEYAVFRRYQNQLTRAERARLENTIKNALFKIDRFVSVLEGPDREVAERLSRSVRIEAREGRERDERRRLAARRADLKLEQMQNFSPEEFEEFVAEIFEALGFEVDRVGGSGDEGADLLVRRDDLRGVVQCKYSKGRAIVGSPELQKFLGTIHHTRCHKGYFVTTRTFSLAAEKFASVNPIELIDGPRLVELVHDALGPDSRRREEPLFG